MSPTTSPSTLVRRRRGLAAVGAAVALALAAQVPQAAVTSAQTPSPAATEVQGSTAGSAVAAPGARTSSFHGGAEWDEGSDVEVDRAGNSCITGFTLSQDLPGAGQGRFAGLADGFVTKVAADGRQVFWRTFLGGVDLDVPDGMAIGEQGSVYLTGPTGSPDSRRRGRPATRFARARLPGGAVPRRLVTSRPRRSCRVPRAVRRRRQRGGRSIAVNRAGRAWIAGNTDTADLPCAGPCRRGSRALPAR